jgi:hypothetical protein
MNYDGIMNNNNIIYLMLRALTKKTKLTDAKKVKFR